MTISLAIQGGFTRGQKKTGAPQLRFFLRVEHQKKRYAVSLRRIRKPAEKSPDRQTSRALGSGTGVRLPV